MRPKLIIDTNKARNNKGFDQLLGNRREIEKFAEACDIVLPRMVIDEIIHQKRKYFEISKQNFTNSSLYKKLPLKTKKQVDSNLQFDEDRLRNDQSIQFTTIDIQDKSAALDEIHRLAVNHEAPFEIYSMELNSKSDNTDKGFKDAYIALTISQYVASLPSDEVVFVLIRDRRLEEYLDKNNRVVCVYDFSNFSKRYQVIGTRSTEIKGVARIIPESKIRQETKTLLTNLRNTPNFTTTHNLVEKLSKLHKDNRLTEDDYLDILISTADNNQINWLLGDSDVQEFVRPIFAKYGKLLDFGRYNTISHGLVGYLSPFEIEPDVDAEADSWIELQSDIARGR